MAKRGSLSEFQAHLANRLAGASEQSAAGLLGVLAGSDHWLLTLPDSGEVVPLPPLTKVPLTHPWFVGCQFHPEFTSSPRHGHPLFTSYVRAAIARQGKA